MCGRGRGGGGCKENLTCVQLVTGQRLEQIGTSDSKLTIMGRMQEFETHCYSGLKGPEFRNGSGITDPHGVNFAWINFLNPS